MKPQASNRWSTDSGYASPPPEPAQDDGSPKKLGDSPASKQSSAAFRTSRGRNRMSNDSGYASVTSSFISHARNRLSVTSWASSGKGVQADIDEDVWEDLPDSPATVVKQPPADTQPTSEPASAKRLTVVEAQPPQEPTTSKRLTIVETQAFEDPVPRPDSNVLPDDSFKPHVPVQASSQPPKQPTSQVTPLPSASPARSRSSSAKAVSHSPSRRLSQPPTRPAPQRVFSDIDELAVPTAAPPAENSPRVSVASKSYTRWKIPGSSRAGHLRGLYRSTRRKFGLAGKKLHHTGVEGHSGGVKRTSGMRIRAARRKLRVARWKVAGSVVNAFGTSGSAVAQCYD